LSDIVKNGKSIGIGRQYYESIAIGIAIFFKICIGIGIGNRGYWYLYCQYFFIVAYC